MLALQSANIVRAQPFNPNSRTTIPLELVDHIFTFIERDKDLLACTFVLRQWCYLAQSILFPSRRITLNCYSEPPEGLSRQLPQLAQFLKQPQSLTTHTRTLLIAGAEHEPTELCHHVLHDVLLSLPHLRELGFEELFFSGCTDHCCGRSFDPIPKSLDKLYIDVGFHQDWLEETVQFLRLFGNLKYCDAKLICRDLKGNPAGAVEDEDRLHELQLPEYLAIQSLRTGPVTSYSPLLPMLAKGMTSQALIDLQTEVPEEQIQVDAFGVFLKFAGHNIRKWRISLMEPASECAFLDSPSHSILTPLRWLQLV